jgi:ABC transporter substrate binding protein (PQQ-dependent alcohol dehydrogenase system)
MRATELRLAVAVMAMIAVVIATRAHAQAQAVKSVPVFSAVLIVAQDDDRLTRQRVERAYLGHPTGPAADGMHAALRDAKLELESTGVNLTLKVTAVASGPQAAAEAARKAEQGGAAVLVVDLDAQSTVAVADAVNLPVINVGESDDGLRGAQCRAKLLHIAPSERMRTDALAQALVARKWASVLLLRGPSSQDGTRAAAALASIKRYGLKLAGERPFKLSNDPRERDLGNPLLLTQGAHDVVWVVDGEGEFARLLPYRTATPRPVVGDAGLVALAWHAQYDRYGATQVSRRFQRAAQRAMSAHDWQAWLAGKALVTAAVAAPSGSVAAFHKALTDAQLDGSKGVTMGFRAWDGQLRQPMLLTDGQGVVGTSPVDGVLHPTNNLDTLGADAPEKLCKARG